MTESEPGPEPQKILSIEEARAEARRRMLAEDPSNLGLEPAPEDFLEPEEPTPPSLWDRVGDIHPGLTYGLLLAILILFAIDLVTTTSRIGNILMGGGLQGPLVRAGANTLSAVARGEWWRLLASIFLHANVVHVASNSLALALLGGVAERAYGHARFLVLFVVAGLAGSLAGLLGQSPTSAGSIGASGAVFGVGAAVVAAAFRMRGLIPPWRARALVGATLPLLLSSLVAGFARPGTDNAAHLGGVLAGAALGSVLGLHPRLTGRHEPAIWKFAATAAGLALVGSAALAVLHG